MKTFKFQLKSGEMLDMTLDQMTRWCCLIEAVDHVTKKCEALGLDPEKEDWVKPIAFQKYIDERFPSLRHDLSVEAALGNI